MGIDSSGGNKFFRNNRLIIKWCLDEWEMSDLWS